MMIRTFIALEIPTDILELALNELKNKIKLFDEYKWEPINKLHITLKFIGEIEEEKIDSIYFRLKNILDNYKKLELELDKFGFFYKDESPRILWLGLKENFTLTQLVLEIDSIINQFGIEKEKRKFKPHITFLRIKHKRNINELMKAKDVKFNNIKFNASKIYLFKSELFKTGSIYKPLKEFQLKEE